MTATAEDTLRAGATELQRGAWERYRRYLEARSPLAPPALRRTAPLAEG